MTEVQMLGDTGEPPPMPEDVRTRPLARSIPKRLRTGRGGSLRMALIVIAMCAVLLGLVQIAVGLGNPTLLWAVLFFTAVFWIWVASGLLAWWRRPDNALGALILFGGIALYLAGLGNTGVVPLVTVSAVFATAPLAVTVHLLHAFPSGRLRGRLSLLTVGLGYVASVGLQFVRVVVPTDAPVAFQIATLAQQAMGISVMIMTSIVLTQRLLAADRRHRRVLLPLFGYGTIAVLLLAVTGPLVRALGLDANVAGTIQLLLSAGIPIAFLLGVLLGGFTRTGELEPLSAWLGLRGATGPAVGRALARTLGDDSLRVVYWSEQAGEYVDELGIPVISEEGALDRGWSEIRVENRLVGAISYDARIIGDPAPVTRAGDVLAIAVDRERLTAQLLASNEALMLSRVRLIEAADRERARIAQDLHDGIQVQLVLLALAAQTIANSPEATPRTSDASAELRRGIDEAAADLRRLVHNVLPSSLTERGLTAATEDLVDRLSIPASLDAEIDDSSISATTTHTAYFILAEALTNAVKHSGASSVRVRLSREGENLRIDIRDNGVGGVSLNQGAGLRGLIDRVDVLGGRLTVDSPRDHGTRLIVDLPCV
ncbi:MAG TPA: histidine kinase [Microbacterium sp.]|nr:histidine kinase [Microbacterium sp.]